MKFNHLNVPDQWQHYWTKYPEGYTIMEALISWVSQVDRMVDNVNNWNVYLDQFVEQFDTELQNTVTTILNEWNDSGFLQDLINEMTNERIDVVESDVLGLKNNKVDKSGIEQITWANISQEAKENFTSGTTAIVGENSVSTNSIVDNSVTREKIAYYSQTPVPLTDLKLKLGGYYSSSTGAFISSQEYGVLVVPVVSGERYVRSGAYSTSGTAETHLSFWNKNGQFVGGNQSTDFIVPESATEMRITISPNNYNAGQTSLTYYANVDPNQDIVKTNLDKPISTGVVSRFNTNWYETSGVLNNVLENYSVEVGVYYTQSGTRIEDENRSTIEIELVAGRSYTKENFGYNNANNTHNTFWDASGAYISGNQEGTFTVPENAVLTRLAIQNELIENTVLYYANEPFKYEDKQLNIERTQASWYEPTDVINNLISQSTLTRGVFYNLSGTRIEDANRSTIEIELVAGRSYTKENFGYNNANNTYNTFWNANGDFISGNQEATFTVPENAVLTRLAIQNELIENTVLYQNGSKYKVIDRGLLGSSNLSGLKWNALGDSITEGSNTTKTYIDYIVERTGVFARNYGDAGTTIADIPNELGEGMVLRYLNMDDDADIITVFGGTNDMGLDVEIGQWGNRDTSTLYGALTVLIEGLYEKYPAKKIGFILPLPRWTINGEHAKGLENYVAAIEEVCGRYSIPILDLYHGSGLMPALSSQQGVTFNTGDTTHPNERGHNVIATKIQRFIESL